MRLAAYGTFLAAAFVANVPVRGAFGASFAELLNGGFETLSADGRVVDWTYDPGAYEVDRGNGRNGTTALRYRGRGGAPILQRVRVSPGARYRFGAWMRTEAMEGKGFGARICLLWEDSYGQHLGGYYKTPHIKGTTNEWVRCEGGPAVAPAGAMWATVRPEVVPPVTGQAWFDDVFFEYYDKKPVAGLHSSAYRDEQASGSVTFAASLRQTGNPSSLKGMFSFVGSDGKKHDLPAGEMTPNSAKITVPVAYLPMGKSTMSFRLLAGDGGREIGAAQLEFTRVASERPRRVAFDRLGRTLVDGKPFFPLGAYWSVTKPYHRFKLPKIDAQSIAEYAKGPFNCVMPYEMPTEEQMDLCHRHGIKVIYAIITRFGGNDWDPSGKDPARRHSPDAVRVIEKFRDHPALLAWYVNDERSVKEMPSLLGRFRTVKELDPDHPAWTVLYQIEELREYMGTFDVMGTDPYPIGHYPISTAWKWADAARRSTLGMRPLWQVPQIFDWAAFRKTPIKTDRMPTREEMANMLWQNIAAGANGLVCYSYTYMLQSPTTPSDKAKADVRAALQTVKDSFDVLLSDGTPPRFSLTADDVVARTWRQGPRVYLLAVNTSRNKATARVTMSGIGALGSIRTRMGDGDARVDGRDVVFSLPPIGFALVEIEV